MSAFEPGLATAETAEIILTNGNVVTLDATRPRATAVAVAAGKIVAVGADAEVLRLKGPRTRAIDLHGRAVLPALTDAHAHLYGLGRSLAQVDLRGCSSPDDCARLVARAVAKAPADEWLQGRGWDQNLFPGQTFPRHDALDRVAPSRPVWLRRVDGHAGWANARALALAGVDRKTADPPGGRIIRDAAGEPTGVLVDAATRLVERAVPEASARERGQAILRAQAAALEHGLTSVHEMGIDEATIAAYRKLEKDGRLLMRVYAFASGGDAAALARLLAHAPEPARAGARFTLRGIKLYADGALGSRGAALLAPYTDDPENRGLVITPADALESAARGALARGWQIAVHAIGDRANRMTLDAFEHAGCTRARDHRFRIEHAQVVALGDIPRFRALGVIASMQPTHATSDMPWAEARLGRARLAGAYAWRRFLDAGVRLAFGSDFPVETVDPIAGLYAAVTRSDGEGRPAGGWLPEERLKLMEAITAFTATAAYSAFEESWRGRAAPGQAADLTILDRDVLAVEPAALRGARVDLTMVGGRIVFERSP